MEDYNWISLILFVATQNAETDEDAAVNRIRPTD